VTYSQVADTTQIFIRIPVRKRNKVSDCPTNYRKRFSNIQNATVNTRSSRSVLDFLKGSAICCRHWLDDSQSDVVYGAQKERYLSGSLQIDEGKTFKFVWIIYYQHKSFIRFEAL
jgi:hypothetical protein